MVGRGVKKQRPGFTLLELMTSIAIIGILIALMVPNIDRSLSRNQLANEVELFRAEVEETRLLAGSTQQIDDNSESDASASLDSAGYYGLFLPQSSSGNYFTIVTISNPINSALSCNLTAALAQSRLGQGPCVVKRFEFSQAVSYNNSADQLMVFRVPSQQLSRVDFSRSGDASVELPDKPWTFSLAFKDRLAEISVQPYSGKVVVDYKEAP